MEPVTETEEEIDITEDQVSHEVEDDYFGVDDTEDGSKKTETDDGADDGDTQDSGSEEVEDDPEVLRQRADQLEKERQEREAREKEEKEQAEKEEAEKAEAQRLKEKAEETGKTVEEVQAQEKAEAEASENERLEKIAKEQGISVDEVKENEQKVSNIIDNYKGDPKELAKAIHARDLDKAKLSSEIESIKNAQAEQQRIINEEQLEAQCEDRRDDIVEGYRKKYPNDSEDLSDEICFERGKQLLKTEWQNLINKKETEFKEKATERRESLSKSIKPEYSEFIPEVKNILKECTDAQVMQDKFDVEAICQMVRGKKFTPTYVKEIEAAAFKRGTEQAKILGEKPAPGAGKPKSNVKYTHSLTDAEKERARAVYSARDDWSDERKFHEYEKNDKQDDF